MFGNLKGIARQLFSGANRFVFRQ